MIIYKIGEVAKLLETTPRTLRFYEEQGMLVPFRSSKGTRLYSEDDVARLTIIQHLGRLGVPLNTIQQLVTARPQSHSGDEASHKVVNLLAELRENIEQKQSESEAVLVQIHLALESIRQCFGCHAAPTATSCKDCAIKERISDSKLFHLIWDKESTTPH